jgi:glycerophosphoryl diester phosphodiesterase
MPLSIIAHRGIRLNEGVTKTRHPITPYAGNTTLTRPGVELLTGKEVDFSVNAYENTLTAIQTAWQLGYKVETDVYNEGIIHHDRFVKRDPSRLIEQMTRAEIAQVNLSNAGESLHDGNRIPSLAETLSEQVKLKRQGLQPLPRLQVELKKPVNIEKTIGLVLRHITSGNLDASDIRVTSFNYDLLKRARDHMAYYPGAKPEIGYLIVHEALDYVYLDKQRSDYTDQLKKQASETIPLFLRERLALPEELNSDFPELAGIAIDEMHEAVPALINRYGIVEFERRYESFLALFIGSGLEAGYRLQLAALEEAPFDIVHIPMDSRPGVTEAYKAKLDSISYRGGKLHANAHSVSSQGKNPAQLLRALAVLDDNAEFTLDYPEMVFQLFEDVAHPRFRRADDTQQRTIDSERKFSMNGEELSPVQLEKAIERLADMYESYGLPQGKESPQPRRGYTTEARFTRWPSAPIGRARRSAARTIRSACRS